MSASPTAKSASPAAGRPSTAASERRKPDVIASSPALTAVKNRLRAWGCEWRKRAASAGVSVRALKAESAIENAIVSENCL